MNVQQISACNITLTTIHRSVVVIIIINLITKFIMLRIQDVSVLLELEYQRTINHKIIKLFFGEFYGTSL